MGREDWLNLVECNILRTIQEPNTPTCWVLVPDDDNSIHTELINSGYSYAFVSLLQVAARNGVQWIYFDADHPEIAGIHVFENADAAWPLHIAGGALQ